MVSELPRPNIYIDAPLGIWTLYVVEEVDLVLRPKGCAIFRVTGYVVDVTYWALSLPCLDVQASLRLQVV